jgi:hypothetical protein
MVDSLSSTLQIPTVQHSVPPLQTSLQRVQTRPLPAAAQVNPARQSDAVVQDVPTALPVPGGLSLTGRGGLPVLPPAHLLRQRRRAFADFFRLHRLRQLAASVSTTPILPTPIVASSPANPLLPTPCSTLRREVC